MPYGFRPQVVDAAFIDLTQGKFLGLTKVSWLAIVIVIGALLAESQIGIYKSELIHHDGPWRDIDQVEAATASWVLWFNTERTHGSIDDLTSLEVEQLDYARNEPVGRAG